MLLSHKTSVKLNNDYCNIIGHMCYAAYKLWNVCNYERYHYKEISLLKVSHILTGIIRNQYIKMIYGINSCRRRQHRRYARFSTSHGSLFYQLVKTHGIKNPKPPRFKRDGIAITYMQNAIVHEAGTSRVRLSLSKQLKDNGIVWNADCVGTFNILRLYFKSAHIKRALNPVDKRDPYVVKVAV